MAATFTRGSPSINSLFSKPIMRKYCTKGTDAVREPMKMEAEEVKKRSSMEGSCCWVPHDRTGIYYPKGQEKVMADVPPPDAKDTAAIHWFSYD